MAFTVTWADATTTFYDDPYVFTTDGGVLKIGMAAGMWTYYMSPIQWKMVDVVAHYSATQSDNKSKPGH